MIYRGMIGLALWLVVAAWGFFADRSYIGLSLSVVTWLILVAVVLSSTLARIGRRDPRRARSSLPFRDWARSELGLWEGRIKGSAAITEIFVPLVAAVVGMTLLAIVRDIVAS
jgi:hypothetical protein